MRLEVQEGAIEDLEKFDKEVQKRIRDEIKELGDKPLEENTSLLSKNGLEIYRLKAKNDELDHRVFFELDNQKVVVLGVEHRDDAYTQESIEKIKSRKQ
ncbi:MAG: type II toxin-antitoxin system RelE/ParE family toxin [Candidatus Nanohaloarchaea archaeon]